MAGPLHARVVVLGMRQAVRHSFRVTHISIWEADSRDHVCPVEGSGHNCVYGNVYGRCSNDHCHGSCTVLFKCDCSCHYWKDGARK